MRALAWVVLAVEAATVISCCEAAGTGDASSFAKLDGQPTASAAAASCAASISEAYVR